MKVNLKRIVSLCLYGNGVKEGCTWVTSEPSILNSASGWGCWASMICLMVTGRNVSFPYVCLLHQLELVPLIRIEYLAIPILTSLL